VAFAEAIDDLVIRDGSYYKKFSHIPITAKAHER